MGEQRMIDVALSRIVIHDGIDRQYIYLSEARGDRGFPIVIGNNEALEIHRVVHAIEPERPLTHQLAYSTIRALGASLKSVDIIDLRKNTFFAHIVLQNDDGDVLTVIDARPSDAIALALRARCQIRVAESVMERASAPEDETEEDE
jgi:bifunctional DNase/RNase